MYTFGAICFFFFFLDFNVTATHIHFFNFLFFLRKYELSVVKYPRQFKRMQLEIKRQFLQSK